MEKFYLPGSFDNQTSLWGSLGSGAEMSHRSKLEFAGTVPCWPGAGLCSDHLLGVRNDLCKCTRVGHYGLLSLLGHCLLQLVVVLQLLVVVS